MNLSKPAFDHYKSPTLVFLSNPFFWIAADGDKWRGSLTLVLMHIKIEKSIPLRINDLVYKKNRGNLSSFLSFTVFLNKVLMFLPRDGLGLE